MTRFQFVASVVTVSALAFAGLIINPGVASAKSQNSSAQNNSAQNNSAQNNSAKNNSAQNNSAQNNSAQNNSAQAGSSQTSSSQTSSSQAGSSQAGSSQTGSSQTSSSQTSSSQTSSSQTSSSQTSSSQAGSSKAGSFVQAACSVNYASGSASSGTIFASACQGPIEGNDTGAQGTAAGMLNGGLFQSFAGEGSWSLGGKSDGGSNDFGFFANNGTSQGMWGFKSPYSGTFAVSFKAGTAYSIYLFNNVSQFTTGMFDTIGTAVDGSGKSGRGLSHASLFVFQPKATTPSQGGGGGQPVPEPMTIMGTAMAAGMGYSLKRKRDQAKQA